MISYPEALDQVEMRQDIESARLHRLEQFIEVLVVGFHHIQAVRTADIAGVSAIVFCRGKRPDARVVEFAKKKRIPVLVTRMVMFDICAVLYNRGLKGVS